MFQSRGSLKYIPHDPFQPVDQHTAEHVQVARTANVIARRNYDQRLAVQIFAVRKVHAVHQILATDCRLEQVYNTFALNPATTNKETHPLHIVGRTVGPVRLPPLARVPQHCQCSAHVHVVLLEEVVHVLAIAANALQIDRIEAI